MFTLSPAAALPLALCLLWHCQHHGRSPFRRAGLTVCCPWAGHAATPRRHFPKRATRVSARLFNFGVNIIHLHLETSIGTAEAGALAA